MITNRTVAVCDILGFRNLVLTHQLNAVVERILPFFSKILHHSTHQGEFPLTPPSLKELKSQTRVGLAWFSDTIILYSFEDTNEDFRRVIEAVGWLIFETMSIPYTRVRAAVSYGDLFVDEQNGLYIGAPIIEAYELQSIQQWVGGALAPSAAGRIPTQDLARNPLDWWLTEYPIPLKCHDPRFINTRFAIDWTKGIHHYWPMEWSDKSKEPTDEDKVQQPDVVAKWINTRDFHLAKCYYCSKQQR